MKIQGNIVDVVTCTVFPGEIKVTDGRIQAIMRLPEAKFDHFILPGFVDAHVHIESSMLIPSEFARLAVVHGTVATISDPHEIANVMGTAGVEYMIENGNRVPFHFNFGAPSCVPATQFETAGAVMDAAVIDRLLSRKEVKYLSEMMNYPGVLSGDEEVLKKIAAAKRRNKPVDGHAPGLTGTNALQYIGAGINTDHECFTYEEGLFKLQHGMKVLIREGSAAKNFEALIPLLSEYPDMIMFCSDDKHPDDLVRGHINQLVLRALAKNIDFWKVIRAATLNPVIHYNLESGLLRTGDFADFIVVNNLSQLKVLQTYIKGILVAENDRSLIEKVSSTVINNFVCHEKNAADFRIVQPAEHAGMSHTLSVKVIEASDGQLITKTFHHPLARLINQDGELVSDIENDILKFTVVNRYADAAPSVAFIKNMGLKTGAIASCVGHDSHNILAAGVSDEVISKAVNAIIREKGGLAVATGDQLEVLPLPVAGIMSNGDALEVAAAYEKIDHAAKKLGSGLSAPFMTLSFMALLVIPQLKLSDKGLFDGGRFEFTSLYD
ncbi:MAG: adenine deaminase [Chitinophagales bacterium]|nr:adenine deaminase [Chitinophagales bacterium]